MKKIIFTPQLFTSFIVLFFLLTISCKSNNPEKNNNIRIEQLNTDYPVTFFKDNENSRMIRIFFRIPFQLTSNITDNNTITSLSYYYSKEFGKPYLTMTAGWSSVLSYNSKTNESIRSFYEFNKDNPAYLYIETQHDIDTIAQVQLELKPYLDKMIELGQDTMSIPSFNEFKKEHPQLVKELLQGDSISVLIKEDLTKNPQLLGDTIIKVAIKY